MEEESKTESTTETTKSKGKKKKKKTYTSKGDGPASNLRSRIQQYQALQNKMSNNISICFIDSGIVKPKVGVVYDEEMLLHRNHREHHPERPERCMSIYLNLVNKGYFIIQSISFCL